MKSFPHIWQGFKICGNEEDDDGDEATRHEEAELWLAANVLLYHTPRQGHTHHVTVKVSTDTITHAVRYQFLCVNNKNKRYTI